MCHKWKDSISAEDSSIFQDSSAFHLCIPILKTEDSQCGTKSKHPAQGLPCRDRAPDVLLRLHHSYLLPEQPLFGRTTQPAPSFKHLGRLVVSGVLERLHRLHCEKMLTAFPREMQVWMQMAVSPLHAQPSAPCRHG